MLVELKQFNLQRTVMVVSLKYTVYSLNIYHVIKE